MWGERAASSVVTGDGTEYIKSIRVGIELGEAADNGAGEAARRVGIIVGYEMYRE
jgi:hypothetical protein